MQFIRQWHKGLIGLCAATWISALFLTLPAPTAPASAARFTLLLGSEHGLTLMIGPQSLCPPITSCPRSLRQPDGVRLWWVDGPPNWFELSAQQALPVVHHRQLLYLRTR